MTPQKLQKAVDGMTQVVQHFKDRSQSLCQSRRSASVTNLQSRRSASATNLQSRRSASVTNLGGARLLQDTRAVWPNEPHTYIYIYRLCVGGCVLRGCETHEPATDALKRDCRSLNSPPVLGPANLYSGASVAHLVGGPRLLWSQTSRTVSQCGRTNPMCVCVCVRVCVCVCACVRVRACVFFLGGAKHKGPQLRHLSLSAGCCNLPPLRLPLLARVAWARGPATSSRWLPEESRRLSPRSS